VELGNKTDEGQIVLAVTLPRIDIVGQPGCGPAGVQLRRNCRCLRRRRPSQIRGRYRRVSREPRRELATALRCLRQIRSLVAKDPDIQGGDPVFKGTRVPVHLIANILNEGASEAEIREAYPRLTSAMIRLTPLYATAYPLRGRPRKTVRLDIAPSRTIRRPLSPPKAS
jgi:uncharacterized protein (DUF433 family)